MGAWQSKATSPPPGWSNLPPELLDLVLRRLPSLADRLRFSAVCRHWLRVATRYSAPHLPRPLPWLNFHDGSFRSLPDGELHRLRFGTNRAATEAACVGSFGRWLLFEKPAVAGRRRRRHFLMNPLRSRTILQLPGRCREPVHVPADGSPPPSGSGRSANFTIRKVIVCSADLVIALANYCRSGCHMVVCCRPGLSSSSPSWSTGICRHGVSHHDMAFYKGKVYTVTWDGELFAHEVVTDGEPRVARVERLIPAPPTQDDDYGPVVARILRGVVITCFLVISAGAPDKLLMVRWIIPFDNYTSEDATRRMKLKVFEADFETSQWLEVKSLDDQVLFVSANSSRAISVATQGHGDYLQGNKIYFVDNRSGYWQLWRPISPRNCGVYDMSSDTIESIPLGDETHIINHQVEASWFFTHG